MIQWWLPIYVVLYDARITNISDVRTLDMNANEWAVMADLILILKFLYMATRVMWFEEYISIMEHHIKNDILAIQSIKMFIIDHWIKLFKLNEDSTFAETTKTDCSWCGESI